MFAPPTLIPMCISHLHLTRLAQTGITLHGDFSNSNDVVTSSACSADQTCVGADLQS